MLRVEGLACGYGGRPVVSGIDLEVAPGELIAVLGPNGAGKTTFIETLMGLRPPVAGTVHLAETEVTRLGAVRRNRLGIAWVPEGRRLFRGMTVEENVLLGCRRAPRAERPARVQEAFTLFPRLQDFRHRTVDSLSGGEQQMVAIARALVARPSVLLLDEPSLGLAPMVVDDIFGTLRTTLTDVAVVLVEQNVAVGLGHATRGVVLSEGRVVRSAPAAELADDEGLRQAYLSVSA